MLHAHHFIMQEQYSIKQNLNMNVNAQQVVLNAYMSNNLHKQPIT